MQIDQRGGKAKTMGCADNPLIDKMVLEDAHYQKKNLSCTWVDVKIALDLLSHWWVIDQRGGKAKTMGCADNPLIDKMVLEDAHYQKKNLSCTWVDVKIALDLLSHWWVIKTLEMHGIHLH